MTEPRYTHDCPQCCFLGTYNDCDLYHCATSATGPTVIARYSADPPDYVSGLALAKSSDPDLGADHRFRALRVAYLIARDAGLEA